MTYRDVKTNDSGVAISLLRFAPGGRYWIVAATLLALLSTGCQYRTQRRVRDVWPISAIYPNDPLETHPGAIPASARLAQLRQLRDEAADKSAEQQERISAQLTEWIKGEDDPIVRAQIVRTLGHYPTMLSADVLTAALRDKRKEVRVAACEAWAQRKGPAAVAHLSRALAKDDNPDVRHAATRGLGTLGDPAAVAPLAAALEDRDPALQYLAAESLKEVSGQDFGSDFRAWQQWARGETPTPREDSTLSLADRIRKVSPF